MYSNLKSKNGLRAIKMSREYFGKYNFTALCFHVQHARHTECEYIYQIFSSFLKSNPNPFDKYTY